MPGHLDALRRRVDWGVQMCAVRLSCKLLSGRSIMNVSRNVMYFVNVLKI